MPGESTLSAQLYCAGLLAQLECLPAPAEGFGVVSLPSVISAHVVERERSAEVIALGPVDTQRELRGLQRIRDIAVLLVKLL